jgi:Flp pilus assembly protein TadG
MSLHSQRGAVIVETAISASLMLLLLLGIFDFSKALYAYHTIGAAAQMGARWAMVRGARCLDASCPATTATVKTFVQSVVPLLDPASVGVTTTWATTSLCAANPATAIGCKVSVTVTYPFTFAVPFVSASTLQLSSTSVMTISE